MNGRVLFRVVVFLAAMSVGVSRAAFVVDWHTADGGGGTSTGGAFSVTGTAGQPDAGDRHAGGAIWLRGGFWAFDEEGALPPALAILLTAADAVQVLWPSPSAGFVLQQTTNLLLEAWAAPSESMQDDGTNRYILVDPPAPQRYYRLLKP